MTHPIFLGARKVTSETATKCEVPHLVFIQQIVIHPFPWRATIHIKNCSICYLTWLKDSRRAKLEEKIQTTCGRWPTEHEDSRGEGLKQEICTVWEREQNAPPEICLLGVWTILSWLFWRKQHTQEKRSTSYPLVRNIYIYKGNLRL